jgi:hypothetical protein
MDLSLELRGARERAGLSREEVSSRLTVQLRYIETLESNLHDLPAGADRDALVRAYARVIGLDPDDIVARAHAEEAGTAELWVAGDVVDAFPKEADLRSPATAPRRADIRPATPTSQEQPDVYPTAPTAAQHADITMAAPRPAERAVRRPDAQMAAELADLPLRATTQVERDHRGVPVAAATSQRSEPPAIEPVERPFDRDVLSSPVTDRRNGIGVAAGALLVIVLAIFAGAYVYERTRATSDGGQAGRAPVSDSPATEVRADPSPESAADGRGDAATTGAFPPAAATTPQHEEGPAAPVPPPPVPPAAEEAGPRPTAQQLPAGDAPGSLQDNPPETALAAPAEDLSGVWTLVTRVESSSITSFEDLELGYRIQFTQNGNVIKGSGQKVSENGRTLAAAAQTPIVLDGTVAGERLAMTFTEHGARRRSAGRFVLVREDGAAWRGRFSSDAARSSGTVLARRAE